MTTQIIVRSGFFRTLRMPLRRVRDWLHERRIAQLRERLIVAQEGERVEAWIALRMAINGRSRGQIDRMERRRGLV